MNTKEQLDHVFEKLRHSLETNTPLPDSDLKDGLLVGAAIVSACFNGEHKFPRETNDLYGAFLFQIEGYERILDLTQSLVEEMAALHFHRRQPTIN